jgi:hypothetical protein
MGFRQFKYEVTSLDGGQGNARNFFKPPNKPVPFREAKERYTVEQLRTDLERAQMRAANGDPYAEITLRHHDTVFTYDNTVRFDGEIVDTPLYNSHRTTHAEKAAAFRAAKKENGPLGSNRGIEGSPFATVEPRIWKR